MTREEFDQQHRQLIADFENERVGIMDNSYIDADARERYIEELRRNLSHQIRDLRNHYSLNRQRSWRVMRDEDGEPYRPPLPDDEIRVARDDRIRAGDMITIANDGVVRQARAEDEVVGVAVDNIGDGFDRIESPRMQRRRGFVPVSFTPDEIRARESPFEVMAKEFFSDIWTEKTEVATKKKTTEYAKCENGHDIWIAPQQREFYLARCQAEGCDKFLKAGSALEEKSSDGPKASKKSRANS